MKAGFGVWGDYTPRLKGELVGTDDYEKTKTLVIYLRKAGGKDYYSRSGYSSVPEELREFVAVKGGRRSTKATL